MGVNFTPSPIVPGEVPSAAKLNDHMATPWTGVQAAWDTYTPAWESNGTAPTLGDGQLLGYVHRIGRTVFYRVELQFGSSTNAGSGAYFFTPPLALDESWRVGAPLGTATVYDASANAYRYRNAARFQSTTSRIVLREDGGTAVGAAEPFVFAVNDRIHVLGMYMCAAGV